VFTVSSSREVATNRRGSCRYTQAQGFESMLAKPSAFLSTKRGGAGAGGTAVGVIPSLISVQRTARHRASHSRSRIIRGSINEVAPAILPANHILRNRRPTLCHPEPRISYYAAPPMTTHAAFTEESRMKFANATKPDRKSGGSGAICGFFPPPFFARYTLSRSRRRHYLQFCRARTQDGRLSQ
jgi:hypothetical protein